MSRTLELDGGLKGAVQPPPKSPRSADDSAASAHAGVLGGLRVMRDWRVPGASKSPRRGHGASRSSSILRTFDKTPLGPTVDASTRTDPPPIRSPDSSSLFSQLTLMWATALARRGWSRPLVHSDLPDPPAVIRSEPLHARAAARWAEIVDSTVVKPGEPKLPRADASLLLKVARAVSQREFVRGCALLVFAGICNTVARPLLLRKVIQSLGSEVSMATALAFAAALAASVWVENWARAHGVFIAGDTAILRVCSSAMQLVSVKATRLRPGAAAEGAEQVLIGKDMAGSAEFARFIPMIAFCISSLVGGLGVLLYTAGPIGLVGIGVMCGTLCVSIPLGRRAKTLLAAMNEAAETTAGCTREIVDGVKVGNCALMIVHHQPCPAITSHHPSATTSHRHHSIPRPSLFNPLIDHLHRESSPLESPSLCRQSPQ